MGSVTTVNKFAFSDDSRTTLSAGMSAAIAWSSGGAANSGVAAYFAGGYAGGYLTTIDKFAFSDDSRSTLASGLSVGRTVLAGAANSGSFTYFAGGTTGSRVDTVDKIAFSDDSRSTLSTGLAVATESLAGAANSGTAAYFAGGYAMPVPAMVDTVYKFAFSDDSRTTLTTGLAQVLEQMAGAANSGIL